MKKIAGAMFNIYSNARTVSLILSRIIDKTEAIAAIPHPAIMKPTIEQWRETAHTATLPTSKAIQDLDPAVAE
jgi:hypothetical protein